MGMNVGSARIYKLMPVIQLGQNSFIIILVNVFRIRSKQYILDSIIMGLWSCMIISWRNREQSSIDGKMVYFCHSCQRTSVHHGCEPHYQASINWLRCRCSDPCETWSKQTVQRLISLQKKIVLYIAKPVKVERNGCYNHRRQYYKGLY